MAGGTVACTPFGSEAGDVSQLRQQVIVHLLQQVPMTPEALRVTLEQLSRCGVLTRDVLPDVGKAPISPGVRPRAAPPSRFELEFERLEQLGRGAFGQVWRCRHKLDGCEYAVKSVRYRTTSSEASQMEEKVLREARIWAAMDHPHIARYHCAWVEVDWVHSGVPGTAPHSGLLPLPPAPTTDCAEWGGGTALRSYHSKGASDSSASCMDSVIGDAPSDAMVTFREHPHAEALEASGGLVALGPEVLETTCRSSSHGRAQEPVNSDQGTPLGSPGGAAVSVRRAEASNVASGGRSPGPAEGDALITYTATLYIQTELCSKETLSTWVAKRNEAFASGAMNQEEQRSWAQQAARIFRQCASAVAYLHARQCVHRDLKPANVLFARDGAVRLGDFGLAKSADMPPSLDGAGSPEDEANSGTRAGHSGGAGTPAYASPEQLAGAPCGVESDAYALGVILVELLTPVRTQMERVAVLRGLREGRWAPAGHGQGALPAAQRLVAAMTKEDPNLRPSVDEVLEAFGEVERELRLPCTTDLTEDGRSLRATGPE